MSFALTDRRTFTYALALAGALLPLGFGHDRLTAVEPVAERVAELEVESGDGNRQAASANEPIGSLADLARHYGRTDVETLPVDFHARVNYWDSRDQAVFVQDEHGAIYLSIPFEYFERHPRLRPGTDVRVIGNLILERYFVQAETIEIAGVDEPVAPKTTQIEDLSLGDRWAQRVRTSGTLREVARFSDLWVASCSSGDTRFVIHQFDEDDSVDWQQWIGRSVEIEGTLICNVDFNGQPFRYAVQRNEFDPPLRAAPRSGDAEDDADEALPQNAPSRTIEQLRTANTVPGTLYRTSGQITSVSQHEGYLIESDGPGIFVHTELAEETSLGHVVEVTVRRDPSDRFRAVTLWSKAFRSVPPPPMDRAESVQVSLFPYRATMEAELIATLSQGERRVVMLRDGDTSFAAILEADDDDWKEASLDNARRVAVTGMLLAAAPEMAEPEQGFTPVFMVELASIDDLRVVSRWWQLSPSLALSVLAVITVVCLTGMLCFATLWLRLQRTVRTNRRLESDLLESRKMDALGRLAGGVAHDFNNLLAAIASNLELIDRGDSQAGEQQHHQCLAAARRCTAQATKLVRSLLGFSRQTKLDLQVGDLNDVVNDAVLLAKTSLPPDVVVKLRLSPDLPPCRVDQTQLEQVFLNLMFNARDALGRQAGTIMVETDSIVDDDGNSMARIRVRDDGHGMNHETSARVFEPFFTTKKVGEGTGLGLALSYGVINQHGGTIDCHSELGVGSVFTILLPGVSIGPDESIAGQTEIDIQTTRRTEAGAAVTAGTDNDHEEVVTGNRLRVDRGQSSIKASIKAPVKPPAEDAPLKILLVDDDDEVRRVAKLSLEAIGHQVTDVAGGHEAIARVEQGESFDAVILDLMMPGISGAETFDRLKSHQPDLPIIVCSGLLIEIENLKQVSGRKPDACLSKPFQLADLQDRLREICPTQRVNSQRQHTA
ncbi:hybrid sensor histidine kinase/response regulator [Rhodopirellula sp. JC639]|uniref:hybrid sensor histidine kinase/response regulator n=1 Tax=Stieleria mannarensis TaxID=2755585 RepID=UPI0015FFCFEE|nr:ATP-binding protein [Rhodopirellula sp. JC639]